MKTVKGPVADAVRGQAACTKNSGDLPEPGAASQAISIMRFASPLEAAVFTMVGYSWWEREFKKQGYTTRKDRFKAQPAIFSTNNQGQTIRIVRYGRYVAMIGFKPSRGAKMRRQRRPPALCCTS
jgi:hypothetical protein